MAKTQISWQLSEGTISAVKKMAKKRSLPVQQMAELLISEGIVSLTTSQKQ